jgi:hypothetical protein
MIVLMAIIRIKRPLRVWWWVIWFGKNVADKYVENVGMYNYNLGCVDIEIEAGGQELEIWHVQHEVECFG